MMGDETHSSPGIDGGVRCVCYRRGSGQTPPAEPNYTYCDRGDPTFQLVFFSVLEGCLQDGLSDADVDQILLKTTPSAQPEHFIYGCPICTATLLALESYRARAEMPMMKVGGKVAFGGGLTLEMHARLYSNDPEGTLVGDP